LALKWNFTEIESFSVIKVYSVHVGVNSVIFETVYGESQADVFVVVLVVKVRSGLKVYGIVADDQVVFDGFFAFYRENCSQWSGLDFEFGCV